MPYALITGGAKRLGQEVSLSLAKQGYDIALHYSRSHTEAEATGAQIEAIGRKCVLYQADLLSAEQCEQLIIKALSELDELNLVINNASIFQRASLKETELELFERNFQIHVAAPFIITRQLAREARKGHIINIVDTAITRSGSAYFAYLLSKKTLFEFTRMAAHELGPDIRVNAIAPGSILEPVDEQQGNYLDKRAGQVPLRLPGKPSYIVQGIQYLLANPFVTGECLFIDGGASLLC